MVEAAAGGPCWPVLWPPKLKAGGAGAVLVSCCCWGLVPREKAGVGAAPDRLAGWLPPNEKDGTEEDVAAKLVPEPVG